MLKKKFILLGMAILMLISIGYAQEPLKLGLEEMNDIRLRKKVETQELQRSNFVEITDTEVSMSSNKRVPEGLNKSQIENNMVRPTIPVEGSAKGKDAYGVFIYPYAMPLYVYWDVDDFHNYSTIVSGVPVLYGGCFFNGVLYAYDYDDWTATVTFFKIDYETGEIIESVLRPELQGKIISALSYDYSEDQMYAIENNAIYLVDMVTGELTYVSSINVGIGNLALTMAIDLEGVMYVISTDGNLYSVNKTTGEKTFVVNTGYYLYYAQSMGFDYETGKLYWNQFFLTGIGYFVEIDINTSEINWLASSSFEVTSFFIPYTHYDNGAPSAATNFTVTPETPGATNVVINWTNPSTTFGGSSLSELTVVKIYENDVLIHTVTNPLVGGTGTLDRNVPASATYTYKIVPENSLGKGPKAINKFFIGIDVPGAVEYLLLSRDGKNGVLTWTASPVGFNGGWDNPATVTYNIMRLPDNVELATGLSALTYTDTSIEQLATYSYQITAVNSVGNGGVKISNSVMLGEAFSIPYTMGFENGEQWELWRIINFADEEGWRRYNNAGYAHTGTASMFYFWNFHVGDDWSFSPPLKFEAGKSYKLNFWARATLAIAPQKLAVYIANGQSSETVIGEAIWVNDQLDHEYYVEYEVFLSDYEPGDYSIGFYCFNEVMGRGYLAIDDFSIKEMASNDVAATTLYGPIMPMVGKQFKYRASIGNKGVNTISNYTVKLIDAENNILASNNAPPAIPKGETLLVDILWTPTEAGVFNLRAVVDFPEDENNDNDETQVVNVTVQSEANVFTGKVGNGNVLFNYMPFYLLSSRTSTSQCIYFEHEIGHQGVIFELNYFSQFVYSNPSPTKPFQIWMANTTQTQLETWIPKSEFTLVYDGLVSFQSGTNKIKIELDIPFEYEGQNLVIMATRQEDLTYYDYRDGFFNTGTQDFPSRTRYSNEFNWTNPGVKTNLHPNIEFLMTFEVGSVSGTVTDLLSIPIDGAMVQIAGKSMKTYTNAVGEYSFDALIPGEYQFNASKHGYLDKLSDEVTVELEENIVVNIELTPNPRKTVFGNVTGNDQPNGLDAVTIMLTGYDNFSGTSDENGDYSIANVYEGFTYTITAKRMGYVTYIGQVTVNDNTEFDLIMDEILYAPSKIAVELIENEYVNVQWQAPIGIDVTYSLDDGWHEVGWRFNGGYDGSFGNIYDIGQSGSIIGFQVWATQWGGSGYEPNFVNVDIYNADRELIGSSQSFTLISNGWVTIELDEYIDYSNTFYAMVRWTAETSGDTHYLGYDTNGPNSQMNLSFMIENGIWSSAPPEGESGVFMIRVNALEHGKSVSFGHEPENNGREFTNYVLYRFEKGQVEANWNPIVESTTNLEYNDYEWGTTLSPGEYQYAVKAEYAGGFSKAKVSKLVLVKDMYIDYLIKVKTNTGEPIQGANVILKNNNYFYNGTSNDEGETTLIAWRGIYDLIVKIRNYEYYEELNVDITEPQNKEVILYDIIYPVGNAVAEYIEENNNVVVTWTEPEPNDERTYVLDDGSPEYAWNMWAGEDAMIGNQFDVGEIGELTSVDIFSIFNPNNGDPKLTIEIFNSEGVLVGTSDEFVIERDTWTNVKLNNINYSGTFFVMVHWRNAPVESHFIGYDNNGPNSGQFLDWFYIAGDWIPFFALTGEESGVFMIRANGISLSQPVSYGYKNVQNTSSSNESIVKTATISNGIKSYAPVLSSTSYCETQFNSPDISNETSLITKTHVTCIVPECIPPQTSYSRANKGFIVYRLEEGETEESNWDLLSEEVTEPTYTDINWSTLDVGFYNFAIKAKYSSGLSEAVLSNSVERELTYTVTVLSNDENWGTVSGGGTFNHGVIATVIATPKPEHLFVNWTKGGEIVSTNVEYTFDVLGNVNLVANFKPDEKFLVTIYVNPEGAGTTTGQGDYDLNDSVTIEATPNEGYIFVNWTKGTDVFSTNASHTFILVEDIVLTANFVLKTYIITPIAGANGTINPNTPQTVNHGASQTFTFIPDTGYEVDEVKVDDVSVTFSNNQYTFTNVTANHTINVTFKLKTYTITPTSGANGSITPNTPQTVSHGASQTFTFTPDTNYEVYDVKVDGGSVTFSNNQYTFTNVTANHAINVTFTTVGINVNVLSSVVLYPNPFKNEINISNSEVVKRVQITNATGQKVKSVTFDGKTISTGELANGVYFVEIESITGDKVVYKMVKK